jgi:hypothetical protein
MRIDTSTHARAVVARAAPTLASGFQVAIGVDATLEAAQTRPAAAVAATGRLLSTASTVAETFEALLRHITLGAVGAALTLNYAGCSVGADSRTKRTTEVEAAWPPVAGLVAASGLYTALRSADAAELRVGFTGEILGG